MHHMKSTKFECRYNNFVGNGIYLERKKYSGLEILTKNSASSQEIERITCKLGFLNKT